LSQIKTKPLLVTALFAFAFCSSLLEPGYLFFVDMEHLFAVFFIVSCALLPPFFVARGLRVKLSTILAVDSKTKIDFSIKSIKESALAKRIGINSAY